MENKLYVIKERFDGTVDVFEVTVETETPKQYKIDDSRVYRSVVNKSELYSMVYGHMFGSNRKELIKKWNERTNEQIEKYSRLIEIEKKLLIK